MMYDEAWVNRLKVTEQEYHDQGDMISRYYMRGYRHAFGLIAATEFYLPLVRQNAEAQEMGQEDGKADFRYLMGCKP